MFELVGTEETDTTFCFGGVETDVGTFEELEDVFDDDGFEVDLLLVVQVLSSQIDLPKIEGSN